MRACACMHKHTSPHAHAYMLSATQPRSNRAYTLPASPQHASACTHYPQTQAHTARARAPTRSAPPHLKHQQQPPTLRIHTGPQRHHVAQPEQRRAGRGVRQAGQCQGGRPCTGKAFSSSGPLWGSAGWQRLTLHPMADSSAPPHILYKRIFVLGHASLLVLSMAMGSQAQLGMSLTTPTPTHPHALSCAGPEGLPGRHQSAPHLRRAAQGGELPAGEALGWACLRMHTHTAGARPYS